MTKHNVIWAALLLVAALGLLGHPYLHIIPFVCYFAALVGAAYCAYRTSNRSQNKVAIITLVALAVSGFAWSLLSAIVLAAVGMVFAVSIVGVADNFDSPDRY